MLDKLNKIIVKYEDLRNQALLPEVFQNPEKAKGINKELANLEHTYTIATQYKKALEAQQVAQELLASEQDSDLLELAQEELDQAKANIEKFDEQLTIALLPKDPNDDKNIYLEIWKPATCFDLKLSHHRPVYGDQQLEFKSLFF
jgi:peptide chain release factor 1